MEITLTNAHRIRKSLEAIVVSKDFVRKIKTNTAFSVFEKDIEKESVVKKVIDASKKQFKEDVSNALQVVDILGVLRATISEKNRELDIGSLLDREASLKSLIRVYTELTQIKANTDSLHVTCGRISHLKAQNNDVNSHYNETELNVNIISEELLEEYKTKLLEAKREQRSVLDKISAINSMNTIDISKKLYDVVESLGIL